MSRVLVIGDTHRRFTVFEEGRVWSHPYVDAINRKIKGRNLPTNVSSTGYYRISTEVNGEIFMHRLMAKCFIEGGWKSWLEVDHKNGDKLDNRICNLRMVDKSGQACGYQKPRGGTSKYRGVAYRRDRDKWEAYINKSGVRYRVGQFDDEDEAALARNLKAEELGFAPESMNQV